MVARGHLGNQRSKTNPQSLKKKPKKYGNDQEYVTKLLDIVSDMQVRKFGTYYTAITSISNHSGYLCNSANIFEFRWKDPYSTLQPHFLTQGNFQEIFCIQYLNKNPIFLAREDKHINFYRLRSNNKLQLLASSLFNPFETNNYRNSICVSNDRNFIFLRETQNKIVLFRHKMTQEEGTLITKLGTSEFDQGLNIQNMFYDYRSKLLLVIFENCQYAMDLVRYSTGEEQKKEIDNKRERIARKQRETRNRSRQSAKSILPAHPSAAKEESTTLITQQRPTVMTFVNKENCHIISSCTNRDRRVVFCSV